MSERKKRMIEATEVALHDRLKLKRYGDREIESVEKLNSPTGQVRLLFKRYGEEQKPLVLTVAPHKRFETEEAPIGAQT